MIDPRTCPNTGINALPIELKIPDPRCPLRRRLERLIDRRLPLLITLLLILLLVFFNMRRLFTIIKPLI